MKTAESKTSSTAAATAAKTSTAPFFSQEPQAESAFFGGEKAESESFFSPKTIQPKLTIGAPNDHYEQQADVVADQVVKSMGNKQSVMGNGQSSMGNGQSVMGNATPSVNGASTASSSSSSPSVQSKCDHCEQEEKLQKKDDIDSVGEQIQKKPIFDSAAEPPPDDVQRKSEGNTEGVASPDFANQLSSSKGGGTALPPETQQQMGNAIGADFSGVRVHTGSEAANMSENIGAQAFTHGNDVYFNEGKYNPSSTEGSHLLAHELTHTVQQGAAVQKKAKPTISETTKPTIQKATPPAAGAKVSSEVVDISKGFNPSEKVKAEIEAEGDKGLMVRIKAGVFAEEGTIKVKKDSKDRYDDKGDGYLALKNDLLTNLGGGFLKVSIKDSQITAYATVGKVGDYKAWINKLKQAPAAIGLSLKVEKIDAAIVNKYENGTLSLGFTGLDVMVGGFFKVALNLQFENMTKAIFEGSAEMTIKGAKGQVSVDNKKGGKLSGSGSLTISEFKGFSGAVEVKYDAETGAMDIHGKAAYSGNKLSGSVELVSTDLASANNFAKQAIAEAGGKTNVQEAKAPGAVPPIKKEGERALAGVGQLTFNLTTWFAGVVTVVVDGKGDLTVIGKIAPPAEIELFKQRDWDKEIFSLQVEAGYGIPVVGTIGVYAAVSLSAIAKLGPAKLYNIEILGTYSTDPEVQKSIQISASLNISAYAGLRLRAEGGAKLTLVGHDLKIGVGVNADVGVKAYADARPTIGYRDPGEFFISGTLDMVAQPMLGLSGDFFIKLDAPWWSPLSDETWTWPIGSKEWPLSDPIGLSAEVKEYVLGSGKVPEVEFKKPEFDGSKFMTNMVDKKLPEKSGGAKEGGGTFKEDGSVPKPPADVPAPKKGGGDKDKGAGKPDAKGGKKPALDPAKGKKDDKGKQKDLEMLQNAGKELEAIKGASLTRAELDKKINGIKNKAKDVTFNVAAEGDKWAITPSCNGQTGKVIRIASNLKPEDKKKEEDKKDGKKDDINSALTEIDTEGKQKIGDGEVTQKDAEQIKADVNRDHPSVIEIKSIKESEETWDFEYVQKKKKSIAKKNEKEEDIGAKTRDIISAPYGKAIRRAEIYRISQVEKKVYIEFLYTKNKEQIEFKDFKKQLANGTIKIANSEREYLMKNRPKYRAGVVEQVWANAASTRGRVFDPNPPRLELFWNKNQDRDAQWHMGHRHGKEYRKLVDEYINGHVDYDGFLNDYNNPNNYYPEDPGRNVSHQNEAD